MSIDTRIASRLTVCEAGCLDVARVLEGGRGHTLAPWHVRARQWWNRRRDALTLRTAAALIRWVALGPYLERVRR